MENKLVFVLMSLYQLICVAAPVSVISLTMTKAVVSKPLRDAIKKKNAFFGELFSCPFCFSFYVALIFQLLFKLNPLNDFPICGLGVGYFMLVYVANIFTGWLFGLLSQID